MIVDIMFRKCNMSNTKDIRYSNELILERLLLKIKSLSNFGILRSFTCDDHPSTVDFLHLHMLQSAYVPVKLALASGTNSEHKLESPLTSFVNQIHIMCKEVDNKNKSIKKSVEDKMKEKIVFDDSPSFDREDEQRMLLKNVLCIT